MNRCFSGTLLLATSGILHACSSSSADSDAERTLWGHPASTPVNGVTYEQWADICEQIVATSSPGHTITCGAMELTVGPADYDDCMGWATTLTRDDCTATLADVAACSSWAPTDEEYCSAASGQTGLVPPEACTSLEECVGPPLVPDDTGDTGGHLDVPCVDDDQEPNDDIAAAIPAISGADRTVCASTWDYWSFSVDPGTMVDVAMLSDDAFLMPDLYDTEGTRIARGVHVGGIYASEVHWANLSGAPMTVYLGIGGEPREPIHYDFDVDLAPGACLVDDDYEPDDAVEDATWSVMSATERVLMGEEADYYGYSVPPDNLIVTTVTYDDTRDPSVWLELTTPTFSSEHAYSGNPLIVAWPNHTGTTADVYADVDLHDPICVTYELTTTIEPLPAEICDNEVDDDLDGPRDCSDPDCVTDPVCGCPTEDAGEDNDTIDAPAIGPVSGTFAVLFDDPLDYWSYPVPPGATLDVEVVQSVGVLRVELWQTRLEDRSHFGDIVHLVSYTNTSAATKDAFLKVVLDDGICAAYTITATTN